RRRLPPRWRAPGARRGGRRPRRDRGANRPLMGTADLLIALAGLFGLVVMAFASASEVSLAAILRQRERRPGEESDGRRRDALAVWLLRPLIALLRLVGRAFGTRVAYPGVANEDEVPFLPAEVEPGWGADRAETQMIAGIIELEETTAREVMVPRIDIVAAPV